ncbi:Mth938-like domain-containing protein [Halodurantibacterium flavum]|uniref:Mth938-like domain-containing protein n=1 Tax=Halodurantibacterium flavum TaxID=1382802 RepID=A0ABW4S9N5_9RHOB
MRLNEIDFRNALPVTGYGPGFFRVGDTVWQGPVLLTWGSVAGWGGYADPAPLLALAGQADVLFIGTGPDIAHLPPDLRAALDEADLPYEVMASAAAARSYNVLLSEGRRIAAALLPAA